jgi:hypothetical protein
LENETQFELSQFLHEYPAILDVEDLKKIMRLGRDSAYKLMRAEDFPSLRIGNQYRVTKPNLIKYLEQKRA